MKSIKYYTRKTHRYLGLFIGIQFLFWAVGGLYFSWTNIDEIHGDHLVNMPKEEILVQNNLLSPDNALAKAGMSDNKFKAVDLEIIKGKNYYRIQNLNGSYTLIDAQTGEIRKPMSKEEAEIFAKQIFKPNNDVKFVEYVTKENISEHGQYGLGPLPAWAVTFNHESNSVVYLSAEKGTYEKIRSKNWRVFDFLFMLHILDFDERDNFNNVLLRGFSIFSLLTILSGFILFYQSSKTIRKTKKKLFKQK